MEIYAATRDAIKGRLAKVKDRELAALSLLIDVWEDKVSGKKYLGTFRGREFDVWMGDHACV
jgi:hypothetical protein